MEKNGRERVAVTFYVWSSFHYDTYIGSYYLLLEYGSYKKFREHHHMKGASNTQLVLLGVIEGLKMLRRPAEITVCSNPLFGITNIYDKTGALREKIKGRNSVEKETIKTLLQSGGHHMKNIYDDYAKQILMDEKLLIGETEIQ